VGDRHRDQSMVRAVARAAPECAAYPAGAMGRTETTNVAPNRVRREWGADVHGAPAPRGHRPWLAQFGLSPLRYRREIGGLVMRPDLKDAHIDARQPPTQTPKGPCRAAPRNPFARFVPPPSPG